MDRTRFESRLKEIVAADDIEADAPLAPHTTFRVGGPADWLVKVRRTTDLINLVRACGDADVPVTVLGSGSNVVIADAGIRGVVVRLYLSTIEQTMPGVVRAEAGVTINGLVRWLIGRGLAGLEAWAGTPGTVGGAIFGNAHWSGRNIGDIVSKVSVVSPKTAAVGEIDRRDMAFAYDTSRLHESGEILLWMEIPVTSAEPESLRRVARDSLAFRKRTQPLAAPSAGCVFQNPNPITDSLPAGMPASAGALLDRAGLKGRSVGGAEISAVHANFIVNTGGATAADIRSLVELARETVATAFGVVLRDEVRYLGTFSNG